MSARTTRFKLKEFLLKAWGLMPIHALYVCKSDGLPQGAKV